MLYIDFEYYKGPLDLLIDLCKKNKIEITTVNISKIIDLYLDFINLKEKSFDLASEYLVLTSYLVELKTKLMLKIESEEEQKLEIEVFINSLLEYKKYQLYSQKLEQMDIDYTNFVSKSAHKFDDVSVVYSSKHEQNQKKLIEIYKKLLKRYEIEEQKNEIKKVNLDEISINDVKENIISKIKQSKKVTFSNIKFKSRIELIVTFLAILELNNTQQIVVKANLGDIEIYAN